ncbi:MAG: magnesium transporter CorA family protein [Patescibacteria group bacterium]
MPPRTLRTMSLANNQSVEWIMVSANDRKTLQAIQQSYGYHDLDLADTAPPLQSTKLAIRDKYLFMILNYPVFDRKTRIMSSAEIDFFIEKNRLTIVDTAGLPQLQVLYNQFESGELPAIYDVPHLLHVILESLVESIFPMLRHISVDVEEIEKKLFKNFERSLIKELLRVKTNIVSVRKAIQGHKSVIRKLVEAARSRYVSVDRLQEYFDKLVDETKDIWDRLELQKNTIDALHETTASLLDYQTNEIMKTLTIISVIVFPLTLVAAIFGMDATGMPLVGHPYGFWIIVGIMALGAVGMLWFFKKKNWL